MRTTRPDHRRPNDIEQRMDFEQRHQITERIDFDRLDDVFFERFSHFDFEAMALLDLARPRPTVKRRPKIDRRRHDLMTLHDLADLAQYRRLRRIKYFYAE